MRSPTVKVPLEWVGSEEHMLTRKINNQFAELRNLRKKVIGKKGTFNRRIIAERTVNGVTESYHATKGWRRKAEVA